MTAMDWNDLALRPLSAVSTGSMNANRHPQSLTGDLPRWMDQNWNTSATGASHQGVQTTHSIQHESMEVRLNRHEQNIMERILQDTVEATVRSADEMVEAQLQAAWERDRDRWQQDYSGSSKRRRGNQHGLLPLESNNGATNGQLALLTDSASTEASSRRSQLVSMPDTWQPNVPNGRMIPLQSPLNVKSAVDHYQVFRTVNDPEKAIEDFGQLLTPNPGEVLPPTMSGFRFAWQLLGHMLTRKRSGTLSLVEQATAVLDFLCLQFQIVVANRIRTSAGGSQAVFQSSTANQCMAFCQLVLRGDQDSIWPAVFYCLRCGDAVAALEVYQSHPQPHASVLKVLGDMAHHQEGAPTVWGPVNAVSFGANKVQSSDRRAIGDLYEGCQHRNRPAEAHEQAVYALLSGVALLPTSDSNGFPGLSAIEDYIVGAIWKALSQDNPVPELQALNKGIRDLGPDYFSDATSGGWDFARPLILTSQYEKALDHLVRSGGPNGLLQATHLGYVLANTQMVPKEHYSGSHAASLLVSYATGVMGVDSLGAKSALEYVARISDRRQARQEVAKLIALTGNLSELVGEVDADGGRVSNGSIIDMYFSHDEIFLLLGEAAELLLRGANQHEAAKDQALGLAAQCYMLAGRYADVLQLLNQVLCPPEAPREGRAYWIQQVDSFDKSYISKKTRVSAALERDGCLSLLKTNRALVKLNAFFSAKNEHRTDVAWRYLEELQLLPSTSAELPSKEANYQKLDPLIKQSFPVVLVACMEMLHEEHSRLKKEVQASTEGVIRSSLMRLREQAKLISTLSGLINVASEHGKKICRLESLII